MRVDIDTRLFLGLIIGAILAKACAVAFGIKWVLW